eukprot:5507091-Pyramimonas_sp.AAC.1
MLRRRRRCIETSAQRRGRSQAHRSYPISLERVPIPKLGEQKARTIRGIGPQKLRESSRSAS